MKHSFNQKLLQSVTDLGSHVCVGLDPDAGRLSEGMRDALVAAAGAGQLRLASDMAGGSEEALRVLACEQTVLAAGASAAAFKPNAAFFEGLPRAGETLAAICRLVRAKCPRALTICDVKRGDIGNTAEQYARAIFGEWGYDAATINPLMGFDAVEPFLRDPARGVFLLCLTSNPGAQEFLLQGDLYKRIAEKAVQWNTNDNVGLVVGATRAEHAAAIRSIAPQLPFLVPGVGAQGGSLADIMEAIDAQGNPRFLVNASRSIMYQRDVSDARNCADRIAAAVADLKEQINQARTGIG